MSDAISWEAIKSKFPAGTKVGGVVVHHAPYGIFVSLKGLPFAGLVEISHFRDSGTMTPAEYPGVGATIEAVVLGFHEKNKQIWLGMKPSELAMATDAEAD